ncbi:MAG: YihY/virulence factor BrkB family protein [Caldilineales bacterium]
MAKLSPARWNDTAEAWFARGDHITRGALSLVRDMLRSAGAARLGQAAAALAYYGLFSLFPLILLLISALNLFVSPRETERVITLVLTEVLPDTQNVKAFVLDGVQAVYSTRGEVTVISLLALLWSASGLFTNLTANIDLAWADTRRARALKSRLVGLTMVLVVYLGLIALLLLSTTLGILRFRSNDLLAVLGLNEPPLRAVTTSLIPWLVMVMVFYGMYRWAPRAQVPRRIALISALFAAVAVQAINWGFTWYLRSGFANYASVYGPLTTIIVLIFWFYLAAAAVLLGAHLGAALNRAREKG